MKNYIKVVVGDDYEEFSSNKDVVTLSELYKEILEEGGCNSLVVICQGIATADLVELVRFLNERNIDFINTNESISDYSETHKVSPENVLISNPTNVGDSTYRFTLNITDKKDRLSDHVTGQHIGAMILMEAARQAVIVGIEREFNILSESGIGLVLNDFNANFSNYTFPIPVNIELKIDIMDRSKNTTSIVTTSTFYQAGRQVSKIQLDVDLYDSVYLSNIEKIKARKAIKKYVSTIESSLIEEE